MTVAVMMAMTVAMSVMGMTMNKAVIVMAVVFVMTMVVVVVVRVVMPVAMIVIVIVRMVMIVAHGRSLRRTVLARQTAKMRALSHDDGQNQARPFPGRLQ